MRPCARSTLVLLTCAPLCIVAPASAENFNRFRGARGDGVVADADMPVEWGPDKNIAWKAKLPGVGWSQPVVWGDKVFVTTAESEGQPRPDPADMGPGFSGLGGLLTSGGLKPPNVQYRWRVMCLDAATGQVLWNHVAREGRPAMQIHPNNTYATETPVTDGEHVIAYFGMTGVYCYDLAGELLWTKDLGAYPMQFGWGTGGSIAILGDQIFIPCDNDQASFLVALDKSSGDEVWRVPREEQSNWATPYVWTNKVRTELVVAGGNLMRSYDPKTGKLLWEMQGSGRTACTPVGDDELVYVESYDRLTGTSGVLAAVRAGAKGDVSVSADEPSNAHVAWSARIVGGNIASPLLYQDCLYLLDNRGGVVRCLNAQSGKEHYRERLPGATGFTASPLANDGRAYFVDHHGRTFVVEAGPKLRVVATNELGEMCWSSPAAAGDRLLIRTADHLYAIGRQ